MKSLIITFIVAWLSSMSVFVVTVLYAIGSVTLSTWFDLGIISVIFAIPTTIYYLKDGI